MSLYWVLAKSFLCFTQVSDSWEEAQDLLCEIQMLQDELAILRLETDALKRQHREKEENYCEDMEILKGKNDDLQKAIKLSEETFAKTISQYIKYIKPA